MPAYKGPKISLHPGVSLEKIEDLRVNRWREDDGQSVLRVLTFDTPAGEMNSVIIETRPQADGSIRFTGHGNTNDPKGKDRSEILRSQFYVGQYDPQMGGYVQGVTSLAGVLDE